MTCYILVVQKDYVLVKIEPTIWKSNGGTFYLCWKGYLLLDSDTHLLAVRIFIPPCSKRSYTSWSFKPNYTNYLKHKHYCLGDLVATAYVKADEYFLCKFSLRTCEFQIYFLDEAFTTGLVESKPHQLSQPGSYVLGNSPGTSWLTALVYRLNQKLWLHTRSMWKLLPRWATHSTVW